MVEVDPALNLRNGQEVLRSIQEWTVQQAHAAKRTIQTVAIDSCDSGKGTQYFPSVAPTEPSIDPSKSLTTESPIDQSQQANGSLIRRSESFVGKGLVRTVVGGLLMVIVGGAVWETYRDDQTRTLIKALGRSSAIWLSSSFGATQRESASSAPSSAKLSDQAAQTPTAMSMEANEIAELKQQLLAAVNDLAVVRRDVEQLSSKQEQLSRDVAAVQATAQNASEKVSSLNQPTPASAQARPQKKVPKLVRAEAPRQSNAASVPPATSPTGTAALTEQPPRPPLPVPTAETPLPQH